MWFPFERSVLGLKSISLDLWVCDDEQISGFMQSYAYKGVAQWLWDFDIRLGICPLSLGKWATDLWKGRGLDLLWIKSCESEILILESIRLIEYFLGNFKDFTGKF